MKPKSYPPHLRVFVHRYSNTPQLKITQQQIHELKLTIMIDSISEQTEPAFKLAPFNPSSLEIQEKALELLKITREDTLFDLGCGDGRLLITAAQRVPGLRCIGIDIDPVFVERGQATVQDLHDRSLKERLDIRLGDALQLPMHASTDLSRTVTDVSEVTLMDDATALYLFVLPKGVVKLMPLLHALLATRQKQRRSFRILSYMFKIHQWEPVAVDKTSRAGCPIYLYEFPVSEIGASGVHEDSNV
jgi:SAM-dependent methyltransferase